MSDLSKEELNAVKSNNQRLKSLGTGTVTTIWKDGKIEKIFVNAEVCGDLYKESGNMILKEVDTNTQ